jgi:hypothetical protein
MAFKDNVFINCPFDQAYLPLLRPLLFCVIYLGFVPRIALEALDSGAPRFEKIVTLIKQSKYAIHDISRLQSTAVGEYFRLNMPFELGLDVGCRIFRSGAASTKRCLILEAERYRYQAAISDLSNSDIAAHSNDPVKATTEVRNWLVNEARIRAPGPADVWARFNEFMAANYDSLKLRGFSDSDVADLPVAELIVCMQDWVDERRA